MSIKYYRELFGMTQSQLAEKLEVDQSAVSHWERGSVIPLAKYQRKLADLFNVPKDNLLSAEKPEG